MSGLLCPTALPFVSAAAARGLADGSQQEKHQAKKLLIDFRNPLLWLALGAAALGAAVLG